MSDTTALANRIRENLAELEAVVIHTIKLSDKATRTGDDDYWEGIALNLHNFYGGIERIFEDIARNIDGSIPTGPDWHRSLSVQMTAESPEIRPPVISRETRVLLEEYRGFRHLIRNVYAIHLRPTRVQELVTRLNDCFEAVRQDLQSFVVFLEHLDLE